MRIHQAAAGLAAVCALSGPAEAGGFKGMARELSRAAQAAGIRSVAVVPFEPADSSSAKEGWNIAERLTTQLVRQKRVLAVERNLLRRLMGEKLLGLTGAIGLPRLRQAGRILSVDAIVTGSFIAAGNESYVAARLIDAETGAILAASEAKAPRDWHDPLGLSSGLAPMPLDPYASAAPEEDARFDPPAAPEFRDALAADDCRDAAGRVDRLEASILDLKARYWAGQLRSGVDVGSLRRNPGATIVDPELRRDFFERMKRWYAKASAPALTPWEVKRFMDADQKAFHLHAACGL